MFKLFSGIGKRESAKKYEDRKHERIDFYQASFFRSEDGSEKTYECWLNNISMGGLCFDSKFGDIKIDETVKVLYKIESKIRHDLCTIRFKGRVLNNWRYGCQFVNEDKQRDELFGNYITDHILSKD